MENPYVYMHGPEHHVLVGSVLLTAYHNAGGELDWPAALYEMENRGRQVPGGALWILGLLRRCGQRGHVCQHRHRRHAAGAGELGALQPDDLPGAVADQPPGRPPVL